MKPAQANVFVPQTRLEVARLCGEGVAERLGEMSVEDVARIHGAESGKALSAQLPKKGKMVVAIEDAEHLGSSIEPDDAADAEIYRLTRRNKKMTALP